MTRRSMRMSWSVVIVGLWSMTGFVSGQERRGAEAGFGAEIQAGVDVRTRGPVHEAFAEPIEFNPGPGIVVSQAPPEPIEEMPPTQKPEGENVFWVSGYWSWDEAEDGFIWVSGIWRVVPPGLEWTPGYWTKVEGGWQWVAGYWSSVEVETTQYLPEPPESLEYGPVGEAPSTEHIWASGNWVWADDDYVWRPGHWVQAHPGWVWTPAHYVYSPRGYIFVDGFWDYSIRRRGVLFAPVVFEPAVYRRPGFVFSPSIAIDVDVLTDHFFVSPRYHHYYFGDYYADTFLSVGIYPWFSFHYSRYGYDPIFAYYHWHYSRFDRDWWHRMRRHYHHRRDHRDDRPWHRWADWRRRDRDRREASLATSIDRLASRDGSRFERIEENRRRQIAERSREVSRVRESRTKIETADRTRVRGRQVDRVQRPTSPIGARQTRELSAKFKPPKKPDTPRPDRQAQEQARRERRRLPDARERLGDTRDARARDRLGDTRDARARDRDRPDRDRARAERDRAETRRVDEAARDRTRQGTRAESEARRAASDRGDRARTETRRTDEAASQRIRSDTRAEIEARRAAERAERARIEARRTDEADRQRIRSDTRAEIEARRAAERARIEARRTDEADRQRTRSDTQAEIEARRAEAERAGRRQTDQRREQAERTARPERPRTDSRQPLSERQTQPRRIERSYRPPVDRDATRQRTDGLERSSRERRESPAIRPERKAPDMPEAQRPRLQRSDRGELQGGEPRRDQRSTRSAAPRQSSERPRITGSGEGRIPEIRSKPPASRREMRPGSPFHRDRRSATD